MNEMKDEKRKVERRGLRFEKNAGEISHVKVWITVFPVKCPTALSSSKPRWRSNGTYGCLWSVKGKKEQRQKRRRISSLSHGYIGKQPNSRD